MNPYANPELWDVFILDGEPLPGLVVDQGDPNNPRNWDKKKGEGSSGATLVFSGEDLTEFTVKLQLITLQDWADYLYQKTRLKAPTGKNPPSSSCFHPSLELLPEPVKAVVILDVTSPKQSGDQWFYSVKFSQDRRAKPAGGKSTGSKDHNGEQKKDAQDQAIDNLVAQVNSLAK